MNNFGSGGSGNGAQQMQNNRNMGGQSFGNEGNFAGTGGQGAMRAGMLGGANFGDNNVMGGRNGDGFQQARSTGIGYGGGGGGRGDRGLGNQQGGGFQQQQGQQRNLFQNMGRLPEGSAQRQQNGRFAQADQYQDGGFAGRAPQYPKSDAYAMSTPGSGLGYNNNAGYGGGRSYNKYRTLDQLDRQNAAFGYPQGPRATFSATDGANYGLPPCYNTESRHNKYRTLDQEMNRQAAQVSSMS
jgi:hypothetical protein